MSSKENMLALASKTVVHQISLALCLFEAIDDMNLSNVIVLLEKHSADPNIIVPDRQIAPIHFAVGFENADFAEKVTKIFLKKKADPNLFSECDSRLTPLHISAIWGRHKIVRMLLEHGGDLDLKCSEGKTAIFYAVHEEHYLVIEAVKKYIFEQKMERRKNALIVSSKKGKSNNKVESSDILEAATQNTITFKTHLRNALQDLEENKFTPNRINYNFDATSPYYINITHRRHKTSRDISINQDTSQPEGSEYAEYEPKVRRNLFELTEENLKEFSKQMSQVLIVDRLAIRKRHSYISDWRKKIQQIRKKDNHIDVKYINYLNTCNNMTLLDETVEFQSDAKSDGGDVTELKSSCESFITAKSDLQRCENAIKALPIPAPFSSNTEYIEEDYIHSDNENGVVFYEKKIISKSRQDLRTIHDNDQDDAKSQSSISTRITLPPLDYDTDTLRKELTGFGENPGPITKSTKFLYLKLLVKYKKDFDSMNLKRTNSSNQIAFSVELQRTVTNHEYLEESVSDFLNMEAQMVTYFLQRSHIKWREGNLKTSFIYLLIDPRISDNLPLHYKNFDKSDVWKRFLSSIFYVGKGKSSRPYCHLYDAIKLFSMENNQLAERLENRRNQFLEKRVLYSNANNKVDALAGNENARKKIVNPNRLAESKKLNRIIDIWKSEMGVVCLHIFHNIMPCEAYTREASIIETIGINNLTNLKKGDFYGIATSWNMRQRRQMGVGLLYRAMNSYLAEGESQLLPFDLM